VNAVIQAAIGGEAVTRVFEGERWFELVVRFLPEFRQDVETIGNIQVSTPSGARIPLKQLTSISTQTGAFIIYRENNERYIPIKFSVRGRDLESTVQEAQARLASEVQLPDRYRTEWAGEYDQLKDEQKRLAIVVPLALMLILILLYTAFNSLRDALMVMATVPFALIGGVFALVLTGTPFSISAAVGVISTLGVTILGGVLLLSRITELRAARVPLEEAIRKGAEIQMRPVLMATLAAAIGLLPAALATGIGSQAQQPLARVVVGGMLTSTVLILMVLPVLYKLVHRYHRDDLSEGDEMPGELNVENETFTTR
jgi:cobalt-zinc-cadmium resistance protein CzcA